MIDHLAKRMAHFAVADDALKKHDEQAYYYGFSILISTFVSVSLVLLIALFAECLAESMFFMCAFILTRTKGGGYHAKSHLRCIALFVATFICVSIVLAFIPKSLAPIFISLLSCTGAIVIWVLAPVAASNKPVSERKRKKYRVQCLVIACVLMGFTVITYLIPSLQCSVILYMYAGYGSAVISMLSAGIKNRKESRVDA